MPEGGVLFYPQSVGGLEGLVLGRLGWEAVSKGIGGMRGIEQEVAHRFPDATSVKGLELGVAAPPKLRVRRGRGKTVALADELDDASARIDMPREYLAGVAMLGAEHFLEVRVIALVIEQRGDGGAQRAMLCADSRDEQERAITHDGAKANIQQAGVRWLGSGEPRLTTVRLEHARTFTLRGRGALRTLETHVFP